MQLLFAMKPNYARLNNHNNATQSTFVCYFLSISFVISVVVFFLNKKIWDRQFLYLLTWAHLQKNKKRPFYHIKCFLAPSLSEAMMDRVLKQSCGQSQGALSYSEQPCFHIRCSQLLTNMWYRQLNTFPLPSILEQSPSQSIKSSTLVKVNLKDARGSHKTHAS